MWKLSFSSHTIKLWHVLSNVSSWMPLASHSNPVREWWTPPLTEEKWSLIKKIPEFFKLWLFWLRSPPTTVSAHRVIGRLLWSSWNTLNPPSITAKWPWCDFTLTCTRVERSWRTRKSSDSWQEAVPVSSLSTWASRTNSTKPWLHGSTGPLMSFIMSRGADISRLIF